MTRRQLLRSAAALPALHAQSQARPNIVLIVADDLGYGHLGCYGNTQVRSPNLDRMANEGVRFRNFFVSWPACTPSRSSILTGRYPQRNGLYDMIRNNEVNWKFQFDEVNYATSPEMTLGMDTREITIGQALKQAGYATGMIGKWDSGRARRFLPRQRGFDFFYGFANTGIDYYTHERYGIPSMFRGDERIQEEGHATDLFHREAVRFVRENRSRPFFLYLAYNAPHGASTFDKTRQQVPSEWLNQYGSGKDWGTQEKALITQMDDSVGRLQKELPPNTLVLFCSDNGGSGRGSKHGGLRGQKSTLFEGGIRVPAIAWWPERIRKGLTTDSMASTLEFMPTLLDVAGSPPPKGVKLDGFSLMPILEGRSSQGRNEMYWEARGERAARVGSWKWVQNRKGEQFLFDLAADVGESNNIATAKPDQTRLMESRWRGWRREMDESDPRGPFRDY